MVENPWICFTSDSASELPCSVGNMHAVLYPTIPRLFESESEFSHRSLSLSFSLFASLELYKNFVYYPLLVTVLEPWDRLCGLVVRVLGYGSGGPGSIPGTTRKKK
jgi:hypothetical protein